MKEIQDIRRAILQRLVDRDGLAETARRFAKPDRQINDMLARRKPFGERVARAMERAYAPELRAGWLDIDPDSPYQTITDGHPPKKVREPNAPIYSVMTPESFRHDLPIISAEQIMEGVSPDRHDAEFMARVPTDSCYAGPASRHAFIFQAEDENMAGGALHIGKGYFAVIEPNAEPDPEDIVLVRISGRRPVLRRLSEGGDALYLVAERGRFDPVRFEEKTCQIIGVVLTAYPRPRSPRMKDSSV